MILNDAKLLTALHHLVSSVELLLEKHSYGAVPMLADGISFLLSEAGKDDHGLSECTRSVLRQGDKSDLYALMSAKIDKLRLDINYAMSKIEKGGNDT
jgi:hypothetical protein